MDRFAQFAVIAAREAVADAGIEWTPDVARKRRHHHRFLRGRAKRRKTRDSQTSTSWGTTACTR